MDASTIIGDVTAVTKKWTKQRKAEERRPAAAGRRQRLFSSSRVTVKSVAEEVMEEAYLKASANGTLPAHARQIMYAARGPIQQETGETLDDKYFTQNLLPRYILQHPNTTAGWDVVFDARGHFKEPHTWREVPLGTLEVRSYLRGVKEKDRKVRCKGLFPTHGATNRFGAVLFVEKEGFLPLFHRVRLAERYDLAIMSTKGMSVVAARVLVDHFGGLGVPVLTLHDFDKAGFSILGLLRRSNWRYAYRNSVRVIDLGLRLADVRSCGLEAEIAHVGSHAAAVANLRRNGATAEEINFLLEGQRVELNAFDSRSLVNWLEEKLRQNGITKVLPDDEVLAEAYQSAFVRESVRKGARELSARAKKHLEECPAPGDLQARVAAALKDKPEEPWDHAVRRIARGAVQGQL
jgi:hypothetical protein